MNTIWRIIKRAFSTPTVVNGKFLERNERMKKLYDRPTVGKTTMTQNGICQ